MRSRRGVALLAAVIALALASALLTAGYFAARESDRSARLLALETTLYEGTSYALQLVLEQWDAPARLAQAIGATAPVPISSSDPPGAAQTWVTRLSARAYWVVARTTDSVDTTAAARAGLLVEIDAPRFPALGALVARGGVRVDGGANIRGNNVLVTGAPSCDSLPISVNGIVVPAGVPAPASAVQRSEAGADSTYGAFGDVDLAGLTRRATRTVMSGATIAPPAGTVTHALGDLIIGPGAGGGIVVVDGRLELQGPLQFSGVIVATDGVVVSTGLVSVTGVVLSAAIGDTSVIVKTNGSMDLRYSACAVQGAELGAGIVQPVRQRAWIPVP